MIMKVQFKGIINKYSNLVFIGMSVNIFFIVILKFVI